MEKYLFYDHFYEKKTEEKIILQSWNGVNYAFENFEAKLTMQISKIYDH